MGTLRCDYFPLGPNLDPRRAEMTGRYIYTFWHENMLLPLSLFGRPDIRVLISRHADGQLIAELARHLGFGLVRGSTTRNSVEAVRQMLRLSQSAHLAITPDGPRGPRRQVQMGMIFLASRTGMPIVPVGVGYARPWRMNSWDRFAVPRPFSRMVCVTPEPMVVPAEAGRDELEHHRRRVEQTLLKVGEMAEHWAASDGRVDDVEDAPGESGNRQTAA
jgi:hypothetical protein